MTHTLKQAVTVDIRVGDETYADTYGPGNVDLPEPVAELLVNLGLAEPSKGGKPTKGGTETPAATGDADTPTDTSTEE